MGDESSDLATESAPRDSADSLHLNVDGGEATIEQVLIRKPNEQRMLGEVGRCARFQRPFHDSWPGPLRSPRSSGPDVRNQA